MKTIYKNIMIIVTFLAIGSILAYIYLNPSKKQISANIPAIQSENNITTPSNNISSNTKTITTHFLSDIVIYNSHSDETYPSGMKVTDVGALINDKLNKEGFKSNFLKCNPPAEYIKSYQNTHDLITNNVKDYTNKVLLDIHSDKTEDINSDKKQIKLVLAKNNPHYEANKKFANLLSSEINKSSQIKSCIFEYANGKLYFNQDLSNNSLLVEVGNNMSSDNDIKECVNTLVYALKNIQED